MIGHDISHSMPGRSTDHTIQKHRTKIYKDPLQYTFPVDHIMSQSFTINTDSCCNTDCSGCLSYRLPAAFESSIGFCSYARSSLALGGRFIHTFHCKVAQLLLHNARLLNDVRNLHGSREWALI